MFARSKKTPNIPLTVTENRSYKLSFILSMELEDSYDEMKSYLEEVLKTVK
jgi:hypothetical protein